MAVHPLRPATRLRLGGPLPHQLPDRPQAHPKAHCCFPHELPYSRAYGVLAQVSPGCPPPRGRSPTCYSPVRHSKHSTTQPISIIETGSVAECSAFDLHVLGTPPAFVLSQDQTLICNSFKLSNFGACLQFSKNKKRQQKAVLHSTLRLLSRRLFFKWVPRRMLRSSSPCGDGYHTTFRT